MLDYIEKLQKKPEHTRRRIAYITTAVLMVFIVAIWVSTLNVRFSEVSNTAEIDSKHSPVSVLTTYSASFREDFGRGMERLNILFKVAE